MRRTFDLLHRKSSQKIKDDMKCLKSTFNDQTGTFLQNQLPYNDRQSDDTLDIITW